MFLDDLFTGGSDFKFLLVTSCACASNLSLMRTLTAYCSRYEGRVVVPETCWLHTMNGATRNSTNIDSGSPLRTAHGVQSVRILGASHQLVAPNSEAWNLRGDCQKRFPANELALSVHDMWTQLVASIFGLKGPSIGFYISGKRGALHTGRLLYFLPGRLSSLIF